eukprot:g31641.t1
MALSQEEKHERASRSLEELEEELKKVREKPGMAASEVKRLESGVEDFQETFKQFGLDDYISKHAPHFAALGLSLDLRRSWLDAVNKSGEQRKEAGEALEAVRAACRNAKETAKKDEDRRWRWGLGGSAEEGIQAAFTQTQEHPLKMEVEIEEEIREDPNRSSKELLDELKPQILEAVKALNVEEASAEVSEAIKEAEVLSEKVRSMALMPAEELQAIAKEMDAKVAEAASSLEAFQDQLCPIEDSTTRRMCSMKAKLDFFQVRLKRLRGILERCAQQIKSQDVFRLKKVRTKVLAMMDVFREDLSFDGFERLLIRFMQVVQTTTMTKNVAITAGEVIRSLKPGELLEVLGGPQTNSAQLRRVFCRAKDGAIGWVTVTSNVGTPFLKDFQPA